MFKRSEYLANLPLEERQSDIISAMRLPLIFGVILIHAVHTIAEPLPALGSVSTANYIYNFLLQFLSENYLRAVVPCFFVFSGYFFFLKYKEQEWSGDFYFKSMSKKFKGLLLPYILWNLIYYVAFWSKNHLFSYLGLGVDAYQMEQLTNYRFEHWIGYSLNAPFWYVRSLLAMMLISPLFFYLFRYLKHWGMILLTLFYLSAIESGVTGFNSTAFMFFGFGAYMGLYKKNILAFAYRLRYAALPLSIVLALVPTLGFTQLGDYLGNAIRLFVPFGVLTLFALTHWICLKSEAIYKFFQKYSMMVFFIYAVNELYITNWVKGALSRIPLMTTSYGQIIYYFLVPVFTIIPCIILYKLMKAYTPKFLALLTGGRV
ncbi:MAG: succinyltransferase [Bacteroidia bacterium]|nr:MAG: succinyltransferase [Bacteroidia bacterium]